MSNKHPVGSLVVCCTKDFPGVLVFGKKYEVMEYNEEYVRVRTERGSIEGFFPKRFTYASEEGVSYGQHIIVRTIDPPQHIGPYVSDKEAKSAASILFPDGGWLIFALEKPRGG